MSAVVQLSGDADFHLRSASQNGRLQLAATRRRRCVEGMPKGPRRRGLRLGTLEKLGDLLLFSPQVAIAFSCGLRFLRSVPVPNADYNTKAPFD